MSSSSDTSNPIQPPKLLTRRLLLPVLGKARPAVRVHEAENCEADVQAACVTRSYRPATRNKASGRTRGGCCRRCSCRPTRSGWSDETTGRTAARSCRSRGSAMRAVAGSTGTSRRSDSCAASALAAATPLRGEDRTASVRPGVLWPETALGLPRVLLDAGTGEFVSGLLLSLSSLESKALLLVQAVLRKLLDCAG